jgi:rhodanese-related sulfurtransferase
MITSERVLEFFGNHPGLSMAFFVILGALLWTLFQGRSHGVRKVDPSNATRLINSDDAVVLDVRTENEYKQGHILNSVHIPQSYLNDQIQKLDKHRDRPIIMACKSGSDSARVGATLLRRGFSKVYSLNGGIAAWEAANLPLVKG